MDLHVQNWGLFWGRVHRVFAEESSEQFAAFMHRCRQCGSLWCWTTSEGDKGQNEDIYKNNVEEKRKQSDRAREQNEAKRKAEQTGLTDKGPQRKAPLTRLPELHPKSKQLHHQHQQARGLTPLNAPNRTAVRVDVMIGRSGMGAGTKRWSGMAESNGRRARVLSQLDLMIVCI